MFFFCHDKENPRTERIKMTVAAVKMLIEMVTRTKYILQLVSISTCPGSLDDSLFLISAIPWLLPILFLYKLLRNVIE